MLEGRCYDCLGIYSRNVPVIWKVFKVFITGMYIRAKMLQMHKYLYWACACKREGIMNVQVFRMGMYVRGKLL